MAEPITLHASATEAGRLLAHFWSTVVGAGRANEGLRADWQRHLATVRAECGFEYVRFHGLLHDDMFLYTEREDGTPVLNFQYFDALLDAEVRPSARTSARTSAPSARPASCSTRPSRPSPRPSSSAEGEVPPTGVSGPSRDPSGVGARGPRSRRG